MSSLIASLFGVACVGFTVAVAIPACSSSSSPAVVNNPDTGTGGKDAARDAPTQEDQDNGDGGDMCGNAAGVLPSDCASCLASKCSMELSDCSCDPECVAAVKCYNGCSEDGGTGLDCEANCTPIGMIGMDAGNQSTLALLNCATTTCASVCQSSNGDGGSSDGGSGDGGSDSGKD
jgi:hypothetical protein